MFEDFEQLFSSQPGANPTIASYSASVVNFYNATGSLVRFINKNTFFLYSKKRSSLLQRWRCSCKFESRRIGSWVASFLGQICIWICTKLHLGRFFHKLIWSPWGQFLTT
jgi:hypothetical protein